MVLVRKRKELAGLIVARLHVHGVAVAGVDRLRLGAPLGVRDLMAALRFAAQPYDNLNLACLLVSPLLGWSQDDLAEKAYVSRQTISNWENNKSYPDLQSLLLLGSLFGNRVPTTLRLCRGAGSLFLCTWAHYLAGAR